MRIKVWVPDNLCILKNKIKSIQIEKKEIKPIIFSWFLLACQTFHQECSPSTYMAAFASLFSESQKANPFTFCFSENKYFISPWFLKDSSSRYRIINDNIYVLTTHWRYYYSASNWYCWSWDASLLSFLYKWYIFSYHFKNFVFVSEI